MKSGVLFNVDDAIIMAKKNGLTGGMTTHIVQNDFVDKVLRRAQRLKCNRIVTNGNLASIIADVAGFTINNKNQRLSNQVLITLYPFGKIDNLEVWVNAAQLWTDNFIHFEYQNEKLERKLKLKTINGTITEEEKQINLGRVYSGEVIDPQHVLI